MSSGKINPVSLNRRQVEEGIPNLPCPIHQSAELAEGFYRKAATSNDLLQDGAFLKGRDALLSQRVHRSSLLDYLDGSHMVLKGMAAAALFDCKLVMDDTHRVLASLGGLDHRAMDFILRALDECWGNRVGIAGRVLREFTGEDDQVRSIWRVIGKFLDARDQVGDKVEIGDWRGDLDPIDTNQLSANIRFLGHRWARRIRGHLEANKPETVSRGALPEFGELWNPTPRQCWPPITPHESLRSSVDRGLAAFESGLSRSVLYLGNQGVGCTSTAKYLCQRMASQGWKVLEISATQLLAGQSHVGALEKRIDAISTGFAKEKQSVWYVPDFSALLDAGRHKHSEVGALEMLEPYLRSGELRMLGDVDRTAWERLRISIPALNELFQTIEVMPLSLSKSKELACDWSMEQSSIPGGLHVRMDLIEEGCRLAGSFRSEIEMPGALMGILQSSVRQADQRGQKGTKRVRVSLGDVLEATSSLVGVPPRILRPQASLSRSRIERDLRTRVAGQGEAVGELAGCVARMLSGFSRNDSKPFGVYLFAGSTGTGKTELAKSVARYISGDSNRLIRIDMSELSSLEAEDRITGVAGPDGMNSLASLVRRHPYSVVLLDEFEKAHPGIFNLFLQVFDEGRLTDKQGRAVSFRNCLFVLTSNLGAEGPARSEVGFGRSEDPKKSSAREQTFSIAFSPEFRNRLTKVIVFNHLSRDVLGKVLDRELKGVHQLPAVVQKQLSIILDSDARSFLVDYCYSQGMGARPVSRAVDQYIIGPIMDHLHGLREAAIGSVLRLRLKGEGLVVE